MMEILEKVEKLKAELDALRPLDSEAEARIMQKFRLDWNYHSNNIEGNSLTYGETKALILFGVTAQGKSLKDHFEITGHNEAVNWVLDLVKGDTELSEVFIRQLHTLVLKESSYKEAETADGKPTQRKIEVGKYKNQPNHVITVTGETFRFAAPEETPAKMEELVNWFRKEKQQTDVNPILLSALFHYKFIRIHPFDDGNGRVARILMNFILMQFGYPPVIIKTEDKENYYAVLTLADADQMEPFIGYIAANLARSLELMIRGAKGEEIEEPDDIEKEISILEKKIRSVGVAVTEVKSTESLLRILSTSIVPAVASFIRICRLFDRFYLDHSLLVQVTPNYDAIFATTGTDVTTYMEEAIVKSGGKISDVKLRYSQTTFTQPDIGEFNYSVTLTCRFGVTAFEMTLESDNLFYQAKPSLQRPAVVSLCKLLYSEDLSADILKSFEKSFADDHKEFIDKKFEEWKLKQPQIEV